MTRCLVYCSGWILVSLLPSCVPQPPAAEKHEARQRKMFGLLEKFDRFDYNGDGYLTRKELGDAVRDHEIPDVTPDKLDQVVKAYDTNGDRRISLSEARKGANLGPQIFETP